MIRLFLSTVLVAGPAVADTLVGGGPRGTDCLVVLQSTGSAFPAGRTARGLSCDAGDACKAEGEAAATPCEFLVSLCVNASDVGRCTPSDVARLEVRSPGDQVDLTALRNAIAGLTLPSGTSQCSPPAIVSLPVSGPDRRATLRPGKARIFARATSSRGRTDRDEYRLVCNPGVGRRPVVTTSTTTTTLPPIVPDPPGAGLQATLLSAAVATDGTVTARLQLTDADGLPVTPSSTATTDPTRARVRLTIARLEVQSETVEGLTTDFTRYVNYILNTVTSPITSETAQQPSYDSGRTFTVEDAAAGIYIYTFATRLPADAPRDATHTIAGQVERAVEGESLVANPLLDFVPDGSAVATVREVTTTAQCNSCHHPLEAHGGARREVKLCQTCHTDQGVDPDTGSAIDFKVMVHRIHNAKGLPSLTGGPVGTKYEFVGFRQSRIVFGERVRFCSGGQLANVPCEDDEDCPGGQCVDEERTCAGGTRGGLACTVDGDCPSSTCVAAIKTAGVGFPRDVRHCDTCHADGATAANALARPSTAACTSCHDDANPGETATAAGPPGTKHTTAGPQPEALCRVCHKPAADEEFDMTVPGAHTIPLRSASLQGIRGEIQSVSNAQANTAPTIRFRITDGSGAGISSLSGFSRVAFALSGPTIDFGAASVPLLTYTVAGGGASGTLTALGDGLYDYTPSNANRLPADAEGTWRVGLEARRTVPVGDGTVEEALQNVVLDFGIDGATPVPRRTVVDQAKCANCHGTFSVDISIHGNLRNQVDHCVICHNPSTSDYARRVRTFCAVTCGADKVVDTTAAGDDVQLIAVSGACATADTCAVAVGPDAVVDTTAVDDDLQRIVVGNSAAVANTEAIDLKHMLHKIHRGEGLENPLVIYGFGSGARGYTALDFSEVRFPGDLRACDSCHVNDSQLLPLADGVLGTKTSTVTLNSDSSKWATTPFVETVGARIPPIQDACRACHDSETVRIHAETNTTVDGGEACTVCHGEGSVAAVSDVHRVAP